MANFKPNNIPNSNILEKEVFSIKNETDFNETALKVFRFQYYNNKVYQSYIDYLNININNLSDFSQIPFLPIEFFKSHKVVSGKFNPEVIFTSSGTTGLSTSRHFVKRLNIYEKSFLKSFSLFFGSPKEYVILGLLPSYLERNGSSLVYMVKKLIDLSGSSESGFFLNNYRELFELLNKLNKPKKPKKPKQKILLLGVTYALLDLAEQFPVNLPNLIIMETGGMKGKRKELVREELHNILRQAFGVDKIFSEYGMTELLSQAYSKGDGSFFTPPWMKVLIRDTNDPFALLNKTKSGGINVVDLANIYSCSFIETGDLGKLHKDGSFEVLGRFDNSDVRGCNLLVD